jgi:hypothetical protein
MAEDHAVIEAKFASMNEVLADFESQSKRTSLVEADFKKHVAGHFAETVVAMQWLDASIDARFSQAKTATEERMDKVDGQFREFLKEIEQQAAVVAGAAWKNSAEAANASGPALSGCAAGPFAAGTGCSAGCGGAASWDAPYGVPTGPPPGCGAGCGNGCSPPVRTPPGVFPANAPSMRQSGECHCHHVTKLQEEMAAVKTEVAHLRSSFGARPFIPAAADVKGEPLSGSTDASGDRSRPTSTSLPLKLGPIGALGNSGRPPFDFRIAGQAEFQFSSKGGDQWKGKTERYLMAVVPAIYPLLEWAERQDEPIEQALYEQAVGEGLTSWDRDGNASEHSQTLNSALWGFLSACVSGEAQTFFKKANKMNGIDAWRRLIRFIDHGRNIRLETLRNEVRTIRSRFGIKSVEEVILGIAKFDNKIQ